MDATCTIQDSIHVFSLVHKYVSRILGTYQFLAFLSVFTLGVVLVYTHEYCTDTLVSLKVELLN